MPGSSYLFLAALFKLLEGPVGCCTPASAALGAVLQLCRSNAHVLQVFLDEVFVVFLWPPEVSVSLRKCPIKKLTWNAGAVHANHMAHPAKLNLYNHGLYTDNFHMMTRASETVPVLTQYDSCQTRSKLVTTGEYT